MKLVETKKKQTIIALSQEELRIILAAVGEIYEGVCVDAREFEIIHGTDKKEVVKLTEDIIKIYKQLSNNNEISRNKI